MLMKTVAAAVEWEEESADDRPDPKEVLVQSIPIAFWRGNGPLEDAHRKCAAGSFNS